MKKNIYISIFGILFTLCGFAQQDPSFSQYYFNPMYVNPAYAGSRDVLSGTLGHRSQWIGMDGAPESQSLNLHSAIPYTKIGLGLQVNNDKAGPMKNTGMALTFAYHLHLGPEARLAFGVSGSLNNVRVDYSKLSMDDATDQAFINNNSSSWVPDASAGLYFYKDRFFAGISTRNLIQSRFKLQDVAGANLARFYRHYYATVGIVTDISDNFAVRPSMLIKYVQAAPAQFDLNAALIYKQQLFFGLGWRTGKRIDIKGMDNMLIASVEYHFRNQLRFGYSYDVYLNRTGTYNSGTHEIMVGWDLNFAKSKMTSPRFF
jgi:type IX secretion system PorP/SprF family membrane protein